MKVWTCLLFFPFSLFGQVAPGDWLDAVRLVREEKVAVAHGTAVLPAGQQYPVVNIAGDFVTITALEREVRLSATSTDAASRLRAISTWLEPRKEEFDTAMRQNRIVPGLSRRLVQRLLGDPATKTSSSRWEEWTYKREEETAASPNVLEISGGAGDPDRREWKEVPGPIFIHPSGAIIRMPPRQIPGFIGESYRIETQRSVRTVKSRTIRFVNGLVESDSGYR